MLIEYLQPHFLLISFVLNLILLSLYLYKCNSFKDSKETIENAKFLTKLEYESARKIRKEAEEYSNKLEIEKKKFDEAKKKFKNQQEDVSKREEDVSNREEDVSKREEDVSKREEDVSKREEDVSKREEDVSKSLQYIEDFKECIRCNVI
jgi:ribonucrease Y